MDPAVNPQTNASRRLENHPYNLGDLPNYLVTVPSNGERKGSLLTVVSHVTLSPGLNTVFDHDGSALVFHELETSIVRAHQGYARRAMDCLRRDCERIR